MTIPTLESCEIWLAFWIRQVANRSTIQFEATTASVSYSDRSECKTLRGELNREPAATEALARADFRGRATIRPIPSISARHESTCSTCWTCPRQVQFVRQPTPNTHPRRRPERHRRREFHHPQQLHRKIFPLRPREERVGGVLNNWYWHRMTAWIITERVATEKVEPVPRFPRHKRDSAKFTNSVWFHIHEWKEISNIWRIGRRTERGVTARPYKHDEADRVGRRVGGWTFANSQATDGTASNTVSIDLRFNILDRGTWLATRTASQPRVFTSSPSSKIPSAVWSIWPVFWAILFAHEMGHFIATVIHRVPASLPFFIPFPLNPMGTMGAVIAMDGRRCTRRQVFDIGIAGPLAGLVIAIPILMYGVSQLDISRTYFGPACDSPILVDMLISMKKNTTHYNGSIAISQLNPYYMAGWVGLLITGLNMMPVSQLDGGHVIYALFGRRRALFVARAFVFLAISLMVFYDAFIWMLMLILVILIGTDHPPTRDDEMPVGVGFERQSDSRRSRSPCSVFRRSFSLAKQQLRQANVAIETSMARLTIESSIGPPVSCGE